MVLVGDNVINETHDNEHAKGYDIDHVLFHPSYEGNAYFDVAVIFTKETIEFNPKVVQTLLTLNSLINEQTPRINEQGGKIFFSLTTDMKNCEYGGFFSHLLHVPKKTKRACFSLLLSSDIDVEYYSKELYFGFVSNYLVKSKGSTYMLA